MRRFRRLVTGRRERPQRPGAARRVRRRVAFLLGAVVLVSGLDASRSESWPGGSPGTGVIQPLPSPTPFRFSGAAPGSAASGPLRYRCVGTFVAPRLAVTAAHCMEGDERSLTLACESVAREARIGTSKVVRQVRHPTHDVVLVEFSRRAVCEAATVIIASSLTSGDRFFISRPPGPDTTSDQATRRARHSRVVETWRGAHTIETLTGTICLSSGDSGTPLFVEPRREPNVIAGLLIGGAEDCAGEQTFVRLDRVRTWIRAQVNREPG